MTPVDIADCIDDHSEGIIATVGVLLVIGCFGCLCYGIWEADNTTETIILHDGNQSYACEVCRGDQTPHNCNPIKEEK